MKALKLTIVIILYHGELKYWKTIMGREEFQVKHFKDFFMFKRRVEIMNPLCFFKLSNAC